MQRAGNRRYYRPADVALARRIHRLLTEEGYTVRGVQKLLRDKDASEPEPVQAPAQVPVQFDEDEQPGGIDVFRLIALRNRLADALEL
jgi:DNA-binding transcriptional MerR regulator